MFCRSSSPSQHTFEDCTCSACLLLPLYPSTSKYHFHRLPPRCMVRSNVGLGPIILLLPFLSARSSLEIAQKNFIASLKSILCFVSSVIGLRFALPLLGFFNAEPSSAFEKWCGHVDPKGSRMGCLGISPRKKIGFTVTVL